MKIEKRIEELGLTLSPAPTPIANYLPAVRVGNIIFLANHGPGQGEGKFYKGKLGKDLKIDDGCTSARYAVLRSLSTIKNTLGDLDRIKRIVKLTGYINSVQGFTDQPKVLDGASDLLVDIFGENGRHARSAIGVAELPNGMPIEIEMIVEVSDYN